MNVKLHIPKQLQVACSKSALKQFLLSLVATTISIVLTFGTAAWIENHKKKQAKREMVMMILYDLAGSIEQVENTDSKFREAFEQQVALAENPKLIEQNPFMFIKYVPTFSYTETVERIFSSNIETINTLGNVLFAENVSDIYQQRKLYKEVVCDSFMNVLKEKGRWNYEMAMDIGFATYILTGGEILNEMKHKFAQCKRMMGVSDAELEVYQKKRLSMAEETVSDKDIQALIEEATKNYERLEAAKGKAKIPDSH